MPNAWLRLEISPGAKVLLAHFCFAASDTGSSWYSYSQLTDIVGRSKASIAAYVKELRGAGIIRTKEQKTANGFNYRLKITLVGWRDLIASWARKSAPSKDEKPAENSEKETECSDQPAERNDPSGQKNQNQENHTPRTSPAAEGAAEAPKPIRRSVWSSEDEKSWMSFRSNDRNPISTYGPLPPRGTEDKLRQHLAFLLDKADMPQPEELGEIVNRKTETFCKKHRISSNDADRAEFQNAIVKLNPNHAQIEHLFESLDAQWHPSWRKISNPAQVSRLAEDPAYKQLKAHFRELETIYLFRSRLSTLQLIENIVRKKDEARRNAA